uniref:DNA polymerase eta n=1 Tax=Glossina pallidipes TaxID=7398 RepID=A0A1B0A2I9_GLOPL
MSGGGSASSSKNFIPIVQKYDRIILLIDMDCFYCQVEEKLDSSLKGKPLAVVQYNAWRGGGIIAVNYAARAKGVTRHMRGDEAKEQCPEIQLVKVPNVREKADLTKYREAGKEVANVLQRFTNLLERASVDEAYLDITEAVNKRMQLMNEGSFVLQPQELVNTYVVGYDGIGEFVTDITKYYNKPSAYEDNDHDDDDGDDFRGFHGDNIPSLRLSNIRLLIGSSIASEIRAAVKAQTDYECSAGIAHNKILAKLACGINKPNKQTILPLAKIPELFETLILGKIKGLGGKFGEEVCERLNIRYVAQLTKFTESELQQKFDEKNGSWLYNICRGIDLEAVTPRFYSKSIGCCKKFPGRNSICGLKTLQHWLQELANEIIDRLEKDVIENNRRAKQMVVSFAQEFDGEDISSSRSAPLLNYTVEALTKSAFEIIKSNTKQFYRAGSESVLNNPIKFLGISVGKFETISNGQNKLQEMFAQQAAKKRRISEDVNEEQIKENFSKAGGNKIEKPDNQSMQALQKEVKTKDVRSFFLEAMKKSDNMQINPDNHKNETNSGKSNDTQVENDEDSKSKIQDKRSPSSRPSKIKRVSESYEDPSANELSDLIDDIRSLQDEPPKNINHETTHAVDDEIKDELKESIQNVEEKQSDYRSDYAEYAIPELKPELLPLTKCTVCGSEIPDNPVSIQTHNDRHVAQKLSEEQRLEYRNSIKTKSAHTSKSPTSSTNTKKTKKDSNVDTRKPSGMGDIKKFFKPIHLKENRNVMETESTSDRIVCDICKEYISKDSAQEHQDFHMAKDLQRKLNQLEVHTVKTKESCPDIAQKRLNLNASQSTQSKAISKPITNFFN